MRFDCSGKAMREAAAQGDNPTGIAVVRFILLSGFRRNEALAIERSWLLDAGGVSFPDTKSGAPVDRSAVLRSTYCVPNASVATGNGFFRQIGGDGHFVGVRKVLSRIWKQAELTGVTPHVLRHTFASVAGELGYSELTIAGLPRARQRKRYGRLRAFGRGTRYSRRSGFRQYLLRPSTIGRLRR